MNNNCLTLKVREKDYYQTYILDNSYDTILNTINNNIYNFTSDCIIVKLYSGDEIKIDYESQEAEFVMMFRHGRYKNDWMYVAKKSNNDCNNNYNIIIL